MNIKNSGLNKQYLVSDTILFQLWQEEIIFLLQKILLIPILREYLIPWSIVLHQIARIWNCQRQIIIIVSFSLHLSEK